MADSSKSTEPHLPDVPRGYLKGEAPDGSAFIIPEFFLPDLYQSFAAHREKMALNVVNAPARVRCSSLILVSLLTTWHSMLTCLTLTRTRMNIPSSRFLLSL